MSEIDTISNGAAGSSSTAFATEQLPVFDVNRKISEVIASYADKFRVSEKQGPFNKWVNPFFPLESSSAGHIMQIENRDRFLVEFTKSSVAVTRKDAPQYTNEDGIVIIRNKRYVVTLYASRSSVLSAFESLPLLFTCNGLDEFTAGLVCEGKKITISMDVHHWIYVPTVVTAFLEVAV